MIGRKLSGGEAARTAEITAGKQLDKLSTKVIKLSEDAKNKGYKYDRN